MNARRVVLLLVVAVVIVAGAVWLGSRGRDDSAVAGGTVLAGLKQSVNDVTEIRLVKGDGTKTTLRKGPTSWMVAEREYPADTGRVRKLLLDLAALNIVEEKTSDPANYQQLSVEDVDAQADDKGTGTLVEVIGPKQPGKLIVGKSSGTKASFVRVAGSKPSLLVSPQLTLDPEPRRWLERAIIDLQQERIKEITVKPAGAPAYTVTREKAEQTDFTVPNLPRGAKLASPSSPNSGASALAQLTLDDVRHSTETPSAPDTATFRTFNGLEIDLVGRKEGERRYVSLTARASARETEEEAQKINARAAGWDFEVPTYKYDSIFRPLSELLEEKTS